jgi:hypothetical protein
MYECVLTHRPPTVRQTVNARTNETTVASAGKGREGGRGEGGMRGEGSVSRRNRVAADGERTTRGRVVGDFIFQIDAARGDDASRGRRRTSRRDDDARATRVDRPDGDIARGTRRRVRATGTHLCTAAGTGIRPRDTARSAASRTAPCTPAPCSLFSTRVFPRLLPLRSRFASFARGGVWRSRGRATARPRVMEDRGRARCRSKRTLTFFKSARSAIGETGGRSSIHSYER